jgi:hypothetical protein
MSPEFDIGGVFVPGLLLAVVVAVAVNAVLQRVLARVGFYRLVWHRALFDLALFVVVLGTITTFSSQLIP